MLIPAGLRVEKKELVSRLAEAARRFPQACLLLSNGRPGAGIEWLAAFGAKKSATCKAPGNAFGTLEKTLAARKAWHFGHFSYDLKNETEQLSSAHADGIGFPALSFFEPEILLRKKAAAAPEMLTGNAEALLQEIPSPQHFPPVKLQQRTSRDAYLAAVKKLLAHIHRGDIYEINYCIEFFAEGITIDPPALFLQLNAIAEAPFTALYRSGDQWLLCASPERFLQKTGSRLVSQPIKGTRPRGKTSDEDRALAEALRNDPKEKSENVMIVDLVRNDLSKTAKRGSVQVDELFGVHSFKTVHQLISTVSAELDERFGPVDAIRAAFPMGSMTGAPKLRAMQLAEQYEQMRRGLYSGAVGYFTPEGDFDFNVVIRSIQYNAATGYLSLMVGSAITANADPEKEYEECLVKARGLFEALGVENPV